MFGKSVAGKTVRLEVKGQALYSKHNYEGAYHVLNDQ